MGGTPIESGELERRIEPPPPVPPLPISADAFGFAYPGAPGPALRDVSFDLEPGALLLVVGPSGSGKSTLARALAGLAPVDAGAGGGTRGALKVGGVDPLRVTRRTASDAVGIVFQDPASQLVMDRAGDDVAFGLENRAWRLAAMRARVPAALALAGLAGFERRRTADLSGGEQQRLALAGALAASPGVLVLDEPTANLDPTGAAMVFEQLEVLRAARAATVVLVEHRAERAWPLADLVLALGADGSPIDVGPPVEVLRRSGQAMARAGIWLPSKVDGAASPRLSLPAGPTVLSIAGVRFGYGAGDPAVREADLDIGAGERVVLVGANGSGKSTLLRLAVGLLRPDEGEVRLLGVDPARLSAGRLARSAGYVHQDPELGFLADTVADEVSLGLGPSERKTAAALLERLGLASGTFGDRSPYRLSGGEQRRLSLATALVRRPALLVLDEPTFGQDRHGHEALVAILDELARDGTAILAATHDERFVVDVADRRLEMAEGWIVGPGGEA